MPDIQLQTEDSNNVIVPIKRKNLPEYVGYIIYTITVIFIIITIIILVILIKDNETKKIDASAPTFAPIFMNATST